MKLEVEVLAYKARRCVLVTAKVVMQARSNSSGAPRAKANN